MDDTEQRIYVAIGTKPGQPYNPTAKQLMADFHKIKLIVGSDEKADTIQSLLLAGSYDLIQYELMD